MWAFFLGNGDGTFATPTTYSTGTDSAPRWLVVSDLNNDGQLDIAVAHSQSGHVGILLGHVDGTFFNEITYTTGDESQPMSIAIGDFNNDGRLDIAISDMWNERIGVFRRTCADLRQNFDRTIPIVADNNID